MLTDEQWQQYDRDGYVSLGRLLDDAALAAMQERIDQIMLGKARLNYDRLLMQLDSETGKYEDAGEQSSGHKGATLGYRKIQNLEYDRTFLSFMQRDVFRAICARHYGADTPVASFRAMFMNKPAHQGTFLPWHQDRWTSLDRDPLVTIWTALDPATVANGCVQVIPGSHRLGIVNPDHPSGFLTREQAERLCPPSQRVFLEVPAGEAVLLHNWLLHGSDVNRTDIPRRAFSVCYMDGRTRERKTGQGFPLVFGPGALDLAQLEAS